MKDSTFRGWITEELIEYSEITYMCFIKCIGSNSDNLSNIQTRVKNIALNNFV